MIRPIYLYGAEVLRQQALPANLDDKEGLKQLIEDLKDTLVESEGCGLAAPQIGVPLRVLVVDGDVMTDVYDYLAGFKRVMINPVILEQSPKTCEYNEGCLSVPGIYADVTFGGGGHIHAAGCLLLCPLAEAKEKIREGCKSLFREEEP